jgi:uncharacterized protein (TIGR02271 family)
MADTFNQGEITPGAPVLTSDGNQLGTVKEVKGRYFKVDAPMAPDYWLSTDCIRSASGQQLLLSVDSNSLDSYKYDRPGDDESGSRMSRATGTIDRDSTATTEFVDDRSAFERSTDTRPTGMTQKGEMYQTATDYQGTATPGQMDRTERMTETTGASRGDRTDRDSVTLHEEQLRAGKVREQAGEVRLGKEIVEEQQSIDVPVTREEVYVERRDAGHRPSDHDISDSDRAEIRVPVTEEHAVAEKETFATEEVSVGKRAVQDTERVSGTVRREEAVIDGDANLRDSGTNMRGSTTGYREGDSSFREGGTGLSGSAGYREGDTSLRDSGASGLRDSGTTGYAGTSGSGLGDTGSAGMSRGGTAFGDSPRSNAGGTDMTASTGYNAANSGMTGTEGTSRFDRDTNLRGEASRRAVDEDRTAETQDMDKPSWREQHPGQA